LKTTGEAAVVARQGAVKVDHFVPEVVEYLHVEGADRATTVSRQAVGIFLGEVHLLT
jgi:hypothetical protein